MAGFTLFVPEALNTVRGDTRSAPATRATMAWLCIASLWTLMLPGGAAVAEQDIPRNQIFAEFKTTFEQGDLAQAETLAQSLVAVTEQEFGTDSRELINPLTNWGTVAFRAGRFAEAEERYQRAVTLLEGQRSGADRLLIRPLQGLGSLGAAGSTYPEATVPPPSATVLGRACPEWPAQG